MSATFFVFFEAVPTETLPPTPEPKNFFTLDGFFPLSFNISSSGLV
jgi:hypothetical protein